MYYNKKLFVLFQLCFVYQAYGMQTKPASMEKLTTITEYLFKKEGYNEQGYPIFIQKSKSIETTPDITIAWNARDKLYSMTINGTNNQLGFPFKAPYFASMVQGLKIILETSKFSGGGFTGQSAQLKQKEHYIYNPFVRFASSALKNPVVQSALLLTAIYMLQKNK